MALAFFCTHRRQEEDGEKGRAPHLSFLNTISTTTTIIITTTSSSSLPLSSITAVVIHQSSDSFLFFSCLSSSSSSSHSSNSIQFNPVLPVSRSFLVSKRTRQANRGKTTDRCKKASVRGPAQKGNCGVARVWDFKTIRPKKSTRVGRSRLSRCSTALAFLLPRLLSSSPLPLITITTRHRHHLHFSQALSIASHILLLLSNRIIIRSSLLALRAIAFSSLSPHQAHLDPQTRLDRIDDADNLKTSAIAPSRPWPTSITHIRTSRQTWPRPAWSVISTLR